jgi:hypothetical protein
MPDHFIPDPGKKAISIEICSKIYLFPPSVSADLFEAAVPIPWLHGPCDGIPEKFTV